MVESSPNTIDLSNRKLTQFFKNLSKVQLKHFRNYLIKFPKGITVDDLAIFDYLFEYHPDYTACPASIFITYFSTTDFNTLLTKSFHTIMNRLNEWLIQQEVENDSAMKQRLLIQAYYKYGAYDAFLSLAKSKLEESERNIQNGPAKIAHEFFIQQQIFHHLDTNRYKIKNGLSQLSESMDELFVAQKLQYICLQTSRKNFIQDETTITFYQEVLIYANQQKKHSYFQLYLQLLDLFIHQDHVLLEQLKEKLPQALKIQVKRDAVIYIHLLINYVSFLLNKGNAQYRQFQFELYKIAIADKLIILNNKISFSTFHNICMIACLLNKLSFAEKFIRTYKDFLEAKISTKVVQLELANLYFYQQRYALTIGEIFNVSLPNTELKILAKPLLIKSYCELLIEEGNHNNYLQQLRNDLKSFKRFVRISKLIALTKKPIYFNFITCVHSLLSILNTKAQITKNKKIKALKTKLSEANYIMGNKSWLLKKLNQLEKRNI